MHASVDAVRRFRFDRCAIC